MGKGSLHSAVLEIGSDETSHEAKRTTRTTLRRPSDRDPADRKRDLGVTQNEVRVGIDFP
jgi:hypothetical protein